MTEIHSHSKGEGSVDTGHKMIMVLDTKKFNFGNLVVVLYLLHAKVYYKLRLLFHHKIRHLLQNESVSKKQNGRLQNVGSKSF